MDERDLINRVRAGDGAAERALYDAHVDRVYRLAYRLAGDDVLAQDFTLESVESFVSFPMPFWTPRRVVTTTAVVIVLLLLGWGTVVLAVAVQSTRDQATTADAIVVLGAAQYNGRPSPVFRARLTHAATLYQRGLAPLVLVTGGVGTGDTLNEANVGRDYLAQLGLPTAALVALPAGDDTHASLAQVRRWFGGRGSRRVLLVSDGFHMLRLRIIAPRLGLVPLTSPAPGSPIRANLRRNTTYLLAEGFKVPFTWLFQH